VATGSILQTGEPHAACRVETQVLQKMCPPLTHLTGTTSDNWTRVINIPRSLLYKYHTHLNVLLNANKWFLQGIEAGWIEHLLLHLRSVWAPWHQEKFLLLWCLQNTQANVQANYKIAVMVRCVQGEAEWVWWCTINSLELHCISHLNLYLNFNHVQGYTFGFHSLPRCLHRNAMKPIYNGHLWFHSKLPNLWEKFSIAKT